MLVLHRGNRLERLVDGLVEVWRSHPGGPLDPRWVVVNNPGMGRWLSFQMAQRMGVCANVRFPLPSGFFWEVVAMAGGLFRGKPPLDTEHLPWLLLRLLPQWMEDSSGDLSPELARLSTADQRERYHFCCLMAELFERYLLYRPDMVARWERGGHGAEDPMERWQGHLWRLLIQEWGGRPMEELRAVMEGFLEGSAPELDILPPWIALFGISHLPPLHLDILISLAARRDVHLFLLDPCRDYWQDAVSPRQRVALARRLLQGGASEQTIDFYLPQQGLHPLLGSLGGLARLFQAALYDRSDVIGGLVDDDICFQEPQGNHLLARLQRRLLSVRHPADEPGLEPHDFSIQVHCCHSIIREVEVLHDQLLDLFSRDPSLQPHHVMVMAPDMGQYAAAVEAVFGAVPPERAIPWSISDLSERWVSPVAAAFVRLLELVGGQVDGPSLMELLEFAPVARKVGIGGEELQLLRELVAESGVRRGWGDEGPSRFSWRFGLDRLMATYLMGPGEDLEPMVALERGLDGEAARIMGRLALFVERVRRFCSAASRSQAPEAWRSFVLSALEELFLPSTAEEEQGAAAVREGAERLCSLARSAGVDEVEPEVALSFLISHLDRPTAPRRFITGKVLFSSLVPMRAIPARVICLLGMDEEAFPRRQASLELDLTARRPRPGDKLIRQEDRYLFLETILSAREVLYISYRGRDERDNSLRLPSGVVTELLDALEADFAMPDGPGLRERLVVEHPLKPFSARYCVEEHPRLFTYASEWQVDDGIPTPPFIEAGEVYDGGRQAHEGGEIALGRLIQFYSNPCKWFLEHEMGLDLEFRVHVLKDVEPFLPDALERYQLMEQLLSSLRLHGASKGAQRARRRCAGAGLLPLPPVEGLVFHEALEVSQDLLHRMEELGPEESGVENLELELDGWRLHAELELWDGRIVTARPARIKGKDVIRLWLCHLLLSATGRLRGESCHLASFQENKKGLRRQRLVLPPLASDDAAAILERLLARHQEGCSRPLPFMPEGAWRYYQAWVKRGDSEAAVAEAMEELGLMGGYGRKRGVDPWLRQALRGRPFPLNEFVEMSHWFFDPMFHAGVVLE